MKDHDIDGSRVIRDANATFRDVFFVMEGDDGRQRASQEIETPDGDLNKRNATKSA